MRRADYANPAHKGNEMLDENFVRPPFPLTMLAISLVGLFR